MILAYLPHESPKQLELIHKHSSRNDANLLISGKKESLECISDKRCSDNHPNHKRKFQHIR